MQRSAPVQVYAAHNEIRERDETMKTATETKSSTMAWAVLSKAVNGRSEVIKVTNCDEADRAVQENPGMFYKAGPFLIA
jgi:hypothetical protein